MIENDEHLFINGITRSGKTYFANYLHKNFEGTSIFVTDPQENETSIYGFEMNRKTRNYEQLEEYDNKIKYQPHWNEEYALKEIEALYNMSSKVTEPIRIFIDEIHLYAPQELRKRSVIDKMFKTGLKSNVQIVGISQSPSDVRKKLIKQIRTHLIFETNIYEHDYLKTKGIPIEKIEKLNRIDYGLFKFSGKQLTGPFQLSNGKIKKVNL